MSDTTFDLVVIGSGAAGLSAAVTGAVLGMSVLVLEKLAVFGGTTATSGGTLWMPGNPIAPRRNIEDSTARALRYLHCEPGVQLDEAQAHAFLCAVPAALEFFERNTELRFALDGHVSDYHTDAPDALAIGRSLVARPFDGARLGRRFAALAQPLRSLTLGGIPMEHGRPLLDLMYGALNLRALAFLTRTMFAHGLDRMRHGRAARLYGGQALAARLMRSALDRGVKLWLSSPARSLRTSEGAVTGVEVQHDGAQVAVYARRGVVLACGGFPQDPARQRELYAHVRRGAHHFSAASVGSNGEGLRLGESVGASVATPASPAAWLPVSLSERDGRREVVPHLSDRAKPGVISIGYDGRRFVNEAGSYHDFVTALLAAYPDAPHAWLICDHKALRRYGLGLVRPRPLSPRAHLRSGYIMRAISVEQLAQRIDVEPGVLGQTIARFNEDARQGSDTAFARGSTAYNRRMGDPAQRPNPCLRALDFAPFYAVKIWPGDLGTFSGLRTDTNARVLGGAGPIRGLYAAGADMINPLGGAYPGAGATLGPALVFGWLAAQHAAGFSD